MRIYPAIDLLGGSVVRLKQGQFGQSTVYSNDPIGIAMQFRRDGAAFLHIVDLDGALACTPRQTDLIRDIVRKTGIRVQVGGGIRTVADAAALKDAGVDRVVLGSVALEDPQVCERIVRHIGAASITIGLDVRINERGVPLIATNAWQETREFSAFDFLSRYAETNLCVLCTDIACDGMQNGPNFVLLRRLVTAFPRCDFLASGGVRDLRDIWYLKDIGVAGVILGTALYEGRLELCNVRSSFGVSP